MQCKSVATEAAYVFPVKQGRSAYCSFLVNEKEHLQQSFQKKATMDMGGIAFHAS